MDKTLGQIAFEAYNESKGGLTYDGKPIPGWDELEGETGNAVRAAWEAASDAAMAGYRKWLLLNPGHAIECATIGTRDNAGRSREQALAYTKLQEAQMWFGLIPMQSP